MKKLMIFVACGIFSLVLSSHAHAASFEDMTSHVESGDGLIYNPESKGVMTKENSIEYVKIVKDKLSNKCCQNWVDIWQKIISAFLPFTKINYGWTDFNIPNETIIIAKRKHGRKFYYLRLWWS